MEIKELLCIGYLIVATQGDSVLFGMRSLPGEYNRISVTDAKEMARVILASAAPKSNKPYKYLYENPNLKVGQYRDLDQTNQDKVREFVLPDNTPGRNPDKDYDYEWVTIADSVTIAHAILAL